MADKEHKEKKIEAAPEKKAEKRPKGTVRLREKFEKEVKPALMKEFALKNPMAVPHLHKIVVNMGVGEATQNAKVIDPAVNEMGAIVGQKPVITKAKKPIAGFKIREGYPIGCMVTLRGARMYEFMERLIKLSLPRIRDFRGVSPRAFDGNGNYTLGVKDQSIFPEIELDKIKRNIGFDVTIVTTAKSDAEAKALLAEFGFPFSDRHRKAA